MSQGTGSGHGNASKLTERFVGAVIRRRGQEQLPAATADQKLLDHAYGKDWKDEDPWRVLRIQGEFVEGFDSLARTGPAITVFGSARTPAGSPEYLVGEQIESGMIGINSYQISVPESPFGGVKESGHGSEEGIEGLDACLVTKFITES